jgi:hypothetical protein
MLIALCIYVYMVSIVSHIVHIKFELVLAMEECDLEAYIDIHIP